MALSQDNFDFVVLMLIALACVLAVIIVSVKIGYWLGYSDGQREGFRDGASFARRKLAQERYNDGYGNYQ